MNKEKILLSGVKPTGRPHIGNYFGAMRQYIDLQDSYKSFIFIADYHALTTVQDKETLSHNSYEMALDYLAIGLDPEKVVLFKQSDVPQVTELAWIFNCITTMPYLMRAHAYKDAEAKNKEINVGVFDYPILMAADILIQDADVVPVGQDQKQHIEYARDIAEKFNSTFSPSKPLLKLPNPLILKEVAVVPGTDGQKMSKSYGNTIELFASREDIIKAVMKIPSGSEKLGDPINPDTCKIFAIHKLFMNPTEQAELAARYTTGNIGYKQSKELLIERIDAFIAPLRTKRAALAKDKASILAMLKRGGEIARTRAEAKMADIRKATGLHF
jgi:tryptophanyl-tRNA synthetase